MTFSIDGDECVVVDFTSAGKMGTKCKSNTSIGCVAVQSILIRPFRNGFMFTEYQCQMMFTYWNVNYDSSLFHTDKTIVS